MGNRLGILVAKEADADIRISRDVKKRWMDIVRIERL